MPAVVGSYLVPIWRTDSYKCYTCVIILTIQRNGRLILEKSYSFTGGHQLSAMNAGVRTEEVRQEVFQSFEGWQVRHHHRQNFGIIHFSWI